MMKKLLMGLSFSLLAFSSCGRAELESGDFQRLCGVYTSATERLEAVRTAGDVPAVLPELEKLRRKCADDRRIVEILDLNVPACPRPLRADYEEALQLQEKMKGEAKRLLADPKLKESPEGRQLSEFLRAVNLRGWIYDERRGKEGAPDAALASREKRMQWWRDAKFGMFIHYGLYSGLEGEFQGKKYGGGVEWIQMKSGADFETYKQEAFPRFKPRSGAADKWVRLARESGCRYVVLTSRHHEGFNMFDTKYTDFNVKKLTGLDVLEEYDAACRKYGMKAGYYFSLLDWNHPDYDSSETDLAYPKGNIEAAKRGERHFGHHDRYKTYLLNIFRELLDRHHVDIAWWDFSHPKFQGDAAWGATQLMKALYDKYPDAVQNNRLYHSYNLLAEGDISVTPHWKGDFTTPEQYVPATGIAGDWETCQTLNGTWGYSAHNQNWKSEEELIRQLVDVVSRGGNFLLNIGPRGDGSIPERSVELFQAIGRWMKVNGEAIYGTRANPFDEEFAWGRVTRKGEDTLYLLVYEKPADGKIVLPCHFAGGAPAARMLHTGRKVPLVAGETACTVDLTGVPLEPYATVVELRGAWRL